MNKLLSAKLSTDVSSPILPCPRLSPGVPRLLPSLPSSSPSSGSLNPGSLFSFAPSLTPRAGPRLTLSLSPSPPSFSPRLPPGPGLPPESLFHTGRADSAASASQVSPPLPQEAASEYRRYRHEYRNRAAPPGPGPPPVTGRLQVKPFKLSTVLRYGQLDPWGPRPLAVRSDQPPRARHRHADQPGKAGEVLTRSESGTVQLARFAPSRHLDRTVSSPGQLPTVPFCRSRLRVTGTPLNFRCRGVPRGRAVTCGHGQPGRRQGPPRGPRRRTTAAGSPTPTWANRSGNRPPPAASQPESQLGRQASRVRGPGAGRGPGVPPGFHGLSGDVGLYVRPPKHAESERLCDAGRDGGGLRANAGESEKKSRMREKRR
eukprot:757237-Hanusia_phi.AAC.1